MLLNFTMKPPNCEELEKMSADPESALQINLKDEHIVAQIKAWKPVTWQVKLRTPPPLKPADHSSMCCLDVLFFLVYC